MSFFKNILDQVKDVAEKSKQSITKVIDNISSKADLNSDEVILPWEREDLEDEVKKQLKEEALNISLV